MVGDQLSIHYLQFEKYRDSAVGAWIKNWGHCASRSVSSSRWPHEYTDSPFLEYYERLYYEHRPNLILAAHRATGDRSFPTSPSEVIWFPILTINCTSSRNGCIGRRRRTLSVGTVLANAVDICQAGSTSSSSLYRPRCIPSTTSRFRQAGRRK